MPLFQNSSTQSERHRCGRYWPLTASKYGISENFTRTLWKLIWYKSVLKHAETSIFLHLNMIGPRMCICTPTHFSSLDGASSCNWGWFYDQQWLGAKYLLIQRLWMGVTSFFLHVWSQFLTDFDVRPLISKLRTSSTRWRSFCDDQMPVTGLIMAKNTMKIADISIFGHHLVPYRHLIIKKT